MQHVDEAPRRDDQSEALPEQRGDLRERQASLLGQKHDQTHDARPEVDTGRSQRVRGLPGMPPLHAAAPRRELADGHITALDDRPDHGEVFLILRRHAQQVHRRPTPRTGRGKRGGVGLIDTGGNGAARPAPRAAAGPPRRREPLRETLVLALQPIALVPRPRQLLAQLRDLFVLVADPFITLVGGGTRAVIGHPRFMADSRQKYKHTIVITPASLAKRR